MAALDTGEGFILFLKKEKPVAYLLNELWATGEQFQSVSNLHPLLMKESKQEKLSALD